MASELLVNKITPESGTTLTLGESGDTISFASGVLPTLESLTITGDLTVDTDTLFVDSTNNRVGIGTSSPTVPLEVNDGAFQQMILRRGNSGVGASIISFLQGDGTAVGHVGGAGSGGGLQLRTGTGTGTERMRIDTSGNVGIGTTSPSQALDVVGNIELSGSIYLGGTTSANALDDYETGTFTVSASRLTGLTTNVGRYTKIGNLVTCEMNLDWTSSDGTGNDVLFTGLPFTTASGTEVAVGATIIYGTDINTDVGASVALRIDDNQTRFYLMKTMDSSFNIISASQVDSATVLRSSFTYMT